MFNLMLPPPLLHKATPKHKKINKPKKKDFKIKAPPWVRFTPI